MSYDICSYSELSYPHLLHRRYSGSLVSLLCRLRSLKNAAHVAPMIEHPDFSAAGKGLVESTAIMQFLCNNWGKDSLYPPVSEAGRRAVVDRYEALFSSDEAVLLMFLIVTVARAPIGAFAQKQQCLHLNSRVNLSSSLFFKLFCPLKMTAL